MATFMIFLIPIGDELFSTESAWVRFFSSVSLNMMRKTRTVSKDLQAWFVGALILSDILGHKLIIEVRILRAFRFPVRHRFHGHLANFSLRNMVKLIFVVSSYVWLVRIVFDDEGLFHANLLIELFDLLIATVLHIFFNLLQRHWFIQWFWVFYFYLKFLQINFHFQTLALRYSRYIIFFDIS